ncbi:MULTISPECIES: hypothetical protein [unclassified Microcoleus]|uniref:hypothetical protein n=1 Tax=unclassified Microcoleus TaxID=2642155 RepID=UPI002FD3DDB0
MRDRFLCLIRVFGLRYDRYMGLAKTPLQHRVTAAMNLSRIQAIGRNIPIGLTGVSSFFVLFTCAGSQFSGDDCGMFGFHPFLIRQQSLEIAGNWCFYAEMMLLFIPTSE